MLTQIAKPKKNSAWDRFKNLRARLKLQPF